MVWTVQTLRLHPAVGRRGVLRFRSGALGAAQAQAPEHQKSIRKGPCDYNILPYAHLISSEKHKRYNCLHAVTSRP